MWGLKQNKQIKMNKNRAHREQIMVTSSRKGLVMEIAEGNQQLKTPIYEINVTEM